MWHDLVIGVSTGVCIGLLLGRRLEVMLFRKAKAEGVSELKVVAARLTPGQEVVKELNEIVRDRYGLQAAGIMCAVGSCDGATLRLARATATNRNEIVKLQGKHEIVSLSGTFSPDGWHLHCSLADGDGQVIGGHLMEMTVFTTCEVIIGECVDFRFAREMDHATGFGELVVKKI